MEKYQRLKQSEFDEMVTICEDYADGNISYELIKGRQSIYDGEQTIFDAISQQLDSSEQIQSSNPDIAQILHLIWEERCDWQSSISVLEQQNRELRTRVSCDATAFAEFEAEIYEARNESGILKEKADAGNALSGLDNLHGLAVQCEKSRILADTRMNDAYQNLLRIKRQISAINDVVLNKAPNLCKIQLNHLKETASLKNIIQRQQISISELHEQLEQAQEHEEFMGTELTNLTARLTRVESDYGNTLSDCWKWESEASQLNKELETLQKVLDESVKKEVGLKRMIQEQEVRQSELQQRIDVVVQESVRCLAEKQAKSCAIKLEVSQQSSNIEPVEPIDSKIVEHSIAEQPDKENDEKLTFSALSNCQTKAHANMGEFSATDQEYTSLEKSLTDMKTQLDLLEGQGSGNFRSISTGISEKAQIKQRPQIFFTRSNSTNVAANSSDFGHPGALKEVQMLAETLKTQNGVLKKQMLVYIKMNERLNAKLSQMEQMSQENQ